MPLFNIAEARPRRPQLVRGAMSGEQVILVRDGKPLPGLEPISPPGGTRQPGSARGQAWMAPDFDGIPEDLDDYTA